MLDRGKPVTLKLETGAAFAHFFTQKASGDKAVTSGDKLSGLEFAGFSRKKTESGKRLEPGFDPPLQVGVAQ